MQKIRKILRVVSEKTALPTNHYRQLRSYRTLLKPVQLTGSIIFGKISYLGPVRKFTCNACKEKTAMYQTSIQETM